MTLNQKTTIACLLCLLTVAAAHTQPLFPDEHWDSGLLDLGNGGDELFYIYFRARHPLPVPRLLIWLNGGPGCSSMIGLFQENGPYRFNRTTLQLVRNPYSWNELSNVLYIDQPAGTGFSRARPGQECRDEVCIAKGLRVFLTKFVESRHPELRGASLYLTGECYAGRYIPAFAAYLSKSEGISNFPLRLRGIMLGAPYTDHLLQETVSADFFYENGIFGIKNYTMSKVAALLYSVPHWLGWKNLTVQLFSSFEEKHYPNPPNIYDIDDPESYDDMDNALERLFNQTSIKSLLGIPPGREFKICSDEVDAALLGDVVNSQLGNLNLVLEANCTVYLLNGMRDGAVDWRMWQQLLRALDWKGKSEYDGTEEQPWEVDGKIHGMTRRARNLVTVRVLGAGHYLPLSQPKFCLEILGRFLSE